MQWRWISSNPAKDARPPRVARIEPLPVPVTMIPVLLEEPAKSNPDLGAWIALAADTGAGRGELCALRWSKVNLETGKVRFDRSIAGDGGADEKDTKNHHHRVVSLSTTALEIMRRHRAAMAERARSRRATTG